MVMILGAGMTGLAAGIATGWPVYEATHRPGGICSSYYLDNYRFEHGGGHWIFGADEEILTFIKSMVNVKTYKRKSSVFFPNDNTFVPYPIQNNLRYPNWGHIAKKEIIDRAVSGQQPAASITMKQYLGGTFGPTLCEEFFYPFHEMYTAGLYDRIAPQDGYKTPIDLNLVKAGATGQTAPVGYNVEFIYPEGGLDKLAAKMAERADVHYARTVMSVDRVGHRVIFSDGSARPYTPGELISTLPLNVTLKMAGLDAGMPDPHTSVLVVNIGAQRGMGMPDDHWLYLPQNASGFHRVGFYSNVDPDFAPQGRVSIYAEKALFDATKFPFGPSTLRLIEALKKWKFIEDVDVVSPTYVDVAYTWSWPNSDWKERAIHLLAKHGIRQLGRYGRWHFQGIAESIREGLSVKV